MIPTLSLLAMVVLELSYRQQYRWMLTTLLLLTWGMIVSSFCWVMPLYDQYRVQAEFAARINQQLGAREPVHLVNLGYDQIIYYLQQPVVRRDHLERFVREQQFATTPSYVIVRPGDLEELQSLGSVTAIDACLHPHHASTSQEKLLLVKISPVQQTGK
jgi:hypothetical protein